MLKRRILASSMASVMALTSVVGVAFADEAEKNYVSAKTLKDYVKKMEDKKTDDYGSVSTATFEKALNYAETVVGDSDATNDEIAVAYLMLKEAEGNLKTYSAEDLNDLLTSYKKDYDGANILNAEMEDNIYTPESYSNFEYEYDNASSVVSSGDKKEITDAYELLDKAHKDLSPLTQVTKADFAREITRLQQAQKMEFDYHAWQRGTVEGTGSKYDGGRYAWSMLFYHVWSAFDPINAQFNEIKDIKTLNKTTDEEVVKAYEACKEAVAVLNGFKADRLNSYRDEAAVKNLVTKTWKSKLLDNDDFVLALLKSATAETGSSDIYLDKECTINTNDVVTNFGTEGTKKYHASDVVKRNQITLYAKIDQTGSKDGSATWTDGQWKITKGTTANDVVSTTVIGNDEATKSDFFMILGAMSDSAEPAKQDNKIWDGNANCTIEDELGKDSKINKVATLNGIKMNSNKLDGWFDHETSTTGNLAPIPGAAGTKSSTVTAAVSNSDKIKAAFMSPGIGEALDALNGESYSGSAAITAGGLQSKSATERKALEEKIISSKAVDLDKLGDKVTATEWTAIGNYLNVALKEWLEKPDDEKYTVAQADTLINESDGILETTSESAVFADLNDKLVTARDALLKNANENRRTTAKEVTTKTYKNCKTAKENLEKALKAFKYSYEEVQKTLADVAKQLDDSSSAIHGDATIEKDMKDVALYLIQASDLTCTADAEDLTDDVLNDNDEFAGYNRVYTEDKTFAIDDDHTINNAKDGPNQDHYNLKTAYEKLLADVQAATETTPGTDVTFDFDGDGVVDTLDVIALNKAIANEETIDLKFDFDGDGAVTSLDVKELAYRIAQELV